GQGRYCLVSRAGWAYGMGAWSQGWEGHPTPGGGRDEVTHERRRFHRGFREPVDAPAGNHGAVVVLLGLGLQRWQQLHGRCVRLGSLLPRLEWLLYRQPEDARILAE